MESAHYNDAQTEFNDLAPTFFKNVTAMVTHKPILKDMEKVESRRVPMLDCKGTYINVVKDVKATNQSPPPPASNGGWEKRRRELMWTEEEHQLFLMGLDKYGIGEWRYIARYYVITRRAFEVAYYAYNYFNS